MVGKRFVDILDTTLRDGAQTRGVSFSMQDKVSIAQRLDDIGVSYIEGGWPGSNPKDQEFFSEIKNYSMKHSEIVAFGSTRKKGISVKDDAILNLLVKSEVKTAVIFGKSWTLHVDKVFHTTLDENLKMIEDTVRYLKDNGMHVLYDAEHFFDGYKEDPKYALNTLKAAEMGGASSLILCDTNGGSLPLEVGSIIRSAKKSMKIPFGIHTHNDGGCAVANTLVAIAEGGTQFHGTVNGLGERCGNVDILQVIPALERKMGMKCLKGSADNLHGLTALSKYVYELANLTPSESQPYVGRNAFSHKGGVHIDAMLKTPRTYEHIDPDIVGNNRELMVSELSGKSGILSKAAEIGLTLDKKSPAVDKILAEVKMLEAKGHHLENATASLHLIIMKHLDLDIQPFEVTNWTSTTNLDSGAMSSAEVDVKVGTKKYHETGEGVGPVHALDLALRRALLKSFPDLKTTKLLNYKVTVVDSGTGTASEVRVFIEFSQENTLWATTALSENILEASCRALIDGYTYRLVADRQLGR